MYHMKVHTLLKNKHLIYYQMPGQDFNSVTGRDLRDLLEETIPETLGIQARAQSQNKLQFQTWNTMPT